MITKRKVLLPAEAIVSSLLSLKEELWENRNTITFEETCLAMKINSCLYSGYSEILRGRPQFEDSE